MRRWFFVVLSVVLSGYAPFALASDLLASTGRLERTDSNGTCSATLISPDVVVTAAHCVNVENTFEHEFPRLFYRPAAPGFVSPVAVVEGIHHPLYAPARDDMRWRFPFDLAVLRLARALPERANPVLSLGPPPVHGETLTLVTWRRRPEAPLVRPCPVLPGPVTVVTLGCSVSSGESGGAVVRKTETGAEIVAVLTSRSRVGDLEIAQASHLDGRVAPMLRRLDAEKEGG